MDNPKLGTKKRVSNALVTVRCTTLLIGPNHLHTDSIPFLTTHSRVLCFAGVVFVFVFVVAIVVLPFSFLFVEDLICEEVDESTGYSLTTACAIFKDLDVSPFNSTIFVPTDTAFENFDALLDDSGVDPTPEEVGEVVLFHGTDETLLYQDLDCSAKVDMWCAETCGQSRTKCMKTDDGNVVKYQKGGGNRKNDILPEIIVADLLTCDGNVVHIISEVMLPNDIDKLRRK